jgi:hypothetical protein
MAIYLFSVKAFVFFPFVVPPLIKREGLFSFESVLYPLYSLEPDLTENTVPQQFVGVFTALLPRNGRPIVPRYASAGKFLLSRCPAAGVHVTI